jgi:D-sedoheptulose 7-phosphate isomerase
MVTTNGARALPAVDAAWFHTSLERTRACFDALADEAVSAELQRVAGAIATRLTAGGTVYWCGNGGSAGDAQHLAAELVGRFGRPGRGWPSLSLSADSSMLTSAGNDFGFETIFQRQVCALVRAEDVVVGISTSGASRNVIAAIEEARRKGALTVALTGPAGGALAEAAEVVIRAPGETTSDIQTCHIAIGQLLCEAAIALAEAGEACHG